MKEPILFTIFSTIAAVIFLYYMCKISPVNKTEGKKLNSIITIIIGSVFFLSSCITYAMFKKMHSTPIKVICIIIALVAVTAIALFVRQIQGIIAKRTSNQRK